MYIAKRLLQQMTTCKIFVFMPLFLHTVSGILVYHQQLDRFCEMYGNNDATDSNYHVWFENILNKVFETDIMRSSNAVLENSNIINILVEKPPIIHCHNFALNVVVETYHDDPTLRLLLKTIAFQFTQATLQNVHILLDVRASSRLAPFELWNPDHGIYIYSKETDKIENTSEHAHEGHEGHVITNPGNDVSGGDRTIIYSIAARRHVNILDLWKYQNCIYLSIDNVLTAHQLNQFRLDLHGHLILPVQVIVN